MSEDHTKTPTNDQKADKNPKIPVECLEKQENPPEKKKPLGLDRCFSPRKEKPPDFVPPASTMKAEYRHPSLFSLNEKKDVAARRALYRSQVIAEMIEEIKRENAVKDPIEDYCTTYDDTFYIEGFKIEDNPKYDEELHLKYPLYKSNPITYYSRIVEKESKSAPSLPGMTKIKDLQVPFKRSYAFTTPVNLRMDGPECYQ